MSRSKAGEICSVSPISISHNIVGVKEKIRIHYHWIPVEAGRVREE